MMIPVMYDHDQLGLKVNAWVLFPLTTAHILDLLVMSSQAGP